MIHIFKCNTDAVVTHIVMSHFYKQDKVCKMVCHKHVSAVFVKTLIDLMHSIAP